MKKLLFIIVLSSSFYLNAQISIITNFENSNCELLYFNKKRNELIFRPSLIDSQNATRCWFYFGLTGFDTSRTLILSEKINKDYIAPNTLIFSYDKKQWQRQKYDSVRNFTKYYSGKFSDDTVWFCTGYPYTYSRMIKYTDSIATYLDTSTLCYSEGGLRVPIYQISTKNQQAEYMVLLIARQHAFESLSNYFLEGIINFLLDSNELSEEVKKNVSFYIVPMMDVDNVYKGASGRMQKPVDFNRCWTSNSYWNAVKSTINFMNEKSKTQKLLLFFDIHSTYPGGSRPLTGIFNIYSTKQAQYSNFKQFLKIFSKTAKFNLKEINGTYYKGQYFADDFFANNQNENLKAKLFATTIECDWNKNNNNKELTIAELRRNGYVFAKSMMIFIQKKELLSK